MSVFDSAASALGKAAGTLDKSSDLLGGKQAASKPLKDSEPKYYKGEWIGHPPDGAGGSTAPFDLRVQESGKIIELIHFGWVHGDYCTNFVHPNAVKDTGDSGLPTEPASPGSRAVMYRAALEREAVLLSGFVASTQTVLKDREDATGGGSDTVSQLTGGGGGPAGFGALAAVGDNLLGAGGSTSAAAAKSGDLNDVNDKLKALGQKLNSTEPMTYTVTHQAGKDLQQQRTNYRVFLGTVLNPPPAPKDGDKGGLLSKVSAIADIVPGAGGIFNLVQGIATKMFDIYVAVYAQLAWHSELTIEKACHDLSLDAIKGNISPIFPPWFQKKPDSADDSSGPDEEEPPLLALGTDGNQPGIGDQLEQAPEKLKDTGKDAAAKALHDLFKVQNDQYWGDPYLTKALFIDVAEPPKDQRPAPAKQVGEFVPQAFEQALGISVPPFAKEIMSQIMQADAEFLEAICQKLIGWDNSRKIPPDAIYAAARRRLLQKLVDLVKSQLSFLQSAQDSVSKFDVLDPKRGKQVKGGEALDKGSDFAMDELTQKLSAEIDPILKFAMQDMAAKLDGFRSTASDQNAMTMEVYLGRLPYLRALLFRNTFFPIWDVVVKQVFGNAAGPISGFLNSAGPFFKGAKGYTDQARDVAHRAKSVDDTFEQQNRNVAAGVGGGENNLGLYQKAWDTGGVQDTPDDPTKGKMKQDFPINGRVGSGSGKKIQLGEWTAVEMIGDQQFTVFKSPPDAPPPAPPPSPPEQPHNELPSLF